MFKKLFQKKKSASKPDYHRQHILYMWRHVPICFEPQSLGSELIYIDNDAKGPACQDCSAELERYSMTKWTP